MIASSNRLIMPKSKEKLINVFSRDALVPVTAARPIG